LASTTTLVSLVCQRVSVKKASVVWMATGVGVTVDVTVAGELVEPGVMVGVTVVGELVEPGVGGTGVGVTGSGGSVKGGAKEINRAARTIKCSRETGGLLSFGLSS